MATSKKRSQALLNTVSVLVLLPVIVTLALRFGPWDLRLRVLTTWMYVSGKGAGCDLERAWNPLELDVPAAQAQLADQVREIGQDGPLIEWDTPHGKMWAPPSTPVMLLSRWLSN